MAKPTLSPYSHILNASSSGCADYCPACRWNREHKPTSTRPIWYGHNSIVWGTFLFLAFALSSVSPAVGQMANNYQASQNFTFATSFSACGSGAAVSKCWAAVNGAPSLTSVAIGEDGDMWGVTTTPYAPGWADHTIVRYDSSTRTFKTMPGALIKIALSDAAHVYGLSAAGYVYEWTGSGWTQIPGQGHDISVSREGTPFLVGMNGRGCGTNGSSFGYEIYKWSGSSWGDSGLSGAVVSAVSNNSVWILCGSGSNNIFHWTNFNNSHGLFNTPGWLASITAMYDDSNVFGIGSGSTPVLYHLDSVSNSFNVVTGNPRVLSAPHLGYIFGLFGNTLEKFGALRIAVQQTVEGSASCSLPNCPSTAIQHTATATLQISGHTKQSISSSSPYPNYLNATAMDFFDPLETEACLNLSYNLFNTPVCPSLTVGGGVTCPLMGTIFNASSSLLSWQVEYARARYIRQIGSEPFNCEETQPGGVLGQIQCDNYVTQWCTPATAPPDYWQVLINDDITPFDVTAWDLAGICERGGTGYSNKFGLWECQALLPPRGISFDNVLPPLMNCTKHP